VFRDTAEHVPVDVVRGLAADVDPQDEAYLLSTSGTTARPKGVLLTHDALARNGRQIGDCQGLVADDVVWAYFPLFFSAGCINVLLGAVSHGAALLVQPDFDPGEALELIDREHATAWHLWPHQLTALMEHPSWHDKHHDRLHKGTGPYDLIQPEPAADGLGGVNMYGMTETSTAFSCTSATDPVEVRIGSQGTLLAGNELLVVDPDTSAPLPAGERGELWVKGPTLLRRYYKVDPAETFTADGWFRTGDLGWIDDDGRVHFDQRAKDVIKTGGINVSPADVEASLVRAAGVRAAYVFALPDAERGEVVGAVVVVDDDGTFSDTADALTALCHDELPGYKRPRAVLALHAGDVPMTASGKVQKFALRDLLLARLATTPTTPPSPSPSASAWLLGPVDSQ
jgi:fatty-acyl-CoA synthase